MQKFLITGVTVLFSFAAVSQDFSNKGKDFWVAYGYHQQMTNGGGGGSQDMVLYFATDQVTNITISIPGIPYTVQNITTGAGNNVVTSVTIPKTGTNDARLTVEGLSNKGIHITSDKPMVAYAHVYNASVSGATILFPTNTLGKEYYSVNYKNWSNNPNSNCWFYVIAADTGTTTLEITPSDSTMGGWLGGTTHTVTLTQGQVYNVMGKLRLSPNNCNPVCTGVDLSGSTVKSINTGSGCKKVAVFSGSGRISITCNNNNSSSDNYMVQALPKTAWGKKYLTTQALGVIDATHPLGNQAFNLYRICVANPATVVKINGAVTALPLQNNFYYEIPVTNQPQLIESDSAIMVAQYFTSQGACGNGGPGDPEMIYLSPVEQNINKVLWNATNNYLITAHYFNVVIPNAGTALSSFTLDGVPLGGFTVHPQDANYSYLRFHLTGGPSGDGRGPHVIQSDSGFNAIAYGFGGTESYGFNAGTNIKDLYQQIGVSSQYGIETSPSICTNSPFKFKVSLPYIPDSMYWNFHNAANMFPNNTNVMVRNVPVNSEDSFTVVNGRSIHWYSLPTLYTFNTVGTYPVTITTYVPNSDCGSVQDIDFDLTVNGPPIADFTFGGSGCVAESFQFTETTPQFPKATYHFWWDFGDPASGAANTSALRNPTHTFSTPGNYTVRFSDITTPGCLSDTISHVVTVIPLPTGTVSGTTTVCINSAPNPVITFTGTDGTPPYTFTYHINGGGPLTVNSVVGNTATVTAPTNVSGVFIYTLDSVKNTGSTLCTQHVTGQTATVTILPDHTITLTSPAASANQTVCINTAIIPIVYTLGGGATGAIITGLPPGVTYAVVGNTLTISGAPTSGAGSPYNFSITTTGNACVTASAIGSITVRPDHTIILTSGVATINQTVCINSPIIPITYDVGGGATGATVTGLPAGVTGTLAGNTFTISGIPTSTVGSPFNYTVTTTGNACVVATATGSITVRPLPTGNFNFNAPSCETRIITFTDASVANFGVVNSWSWDFGDPTSGAANTSVLQNPTHVFATAGSYTVTLIVTSTSTCVSPGFQRIVNINARPQAGYIIPEVCLSDTYAQFIDTSKVSVGTIVAWAWNFGDPPSGVNNTSTLQNPQHSYSAVGNYLVQLIVTSNTGCKDTIVQTLGVNGSFPVAGFTVNNSSTLCANDSVAIVNTSTVFPGVITKVEIWWDDVNAGPPTPPFLDNFPYAGKVYKHLYPNFQTPLTKVYRIRFRAYSGGVCLNDKLGNVTINAAPKVQFNAIPDTCLLVNPFQITEASEVGGVPGSGTFSGAGVTPSGIFSPSIAGVGTHTIMYTYTSSAAGCVDTMSRTITVLDTAHASFTWVAPICDGVPGSFTDQSTAPAAVILANTIWDFGDGSPLQNHLPGSTFTHLFPGPNTYLVKMYNVSAYGCNSTTYSQFVTVDPNHTIQLTSGIPTTNQTVCINNAITPITYTLGGGATGATVSGLPTGVTYNVAGTTLTITGSPNTTAGSPFNYIITTTGNTCTVATATGRISVSPDHTLTLTSGASSTNQRVCLNTPINNITYSLGGGATGATITGLPPGITYAVAGTTLTISGSPNTIAGTPYNYSITTTGNNCVTASDVGVIKVSPYPITDFSFDKPSYCIPNATVTFNNTSTISDGTANAFTYLWNFGDPGNGINNTSVAKNPSHYYTGTGPFNVKLVVTSGFGCAHDTTISLNTIHPQPKAMFGSDKPSVCIADVVTFIDQTVANVQRWSWDFGDGQTGSTSPIPHLYLSDKTYNVTLYVIDNNGCNSDTLTKPFTVYPYPVVDAGPDRYILDDGMITLDAVTSGNDLQILWTPNLYMVDNKVEKPTIKNVLNDITYKLTVTARGGCAKSDLVFVKLLRRPKIPNTFTPNNDGINDTWKIDYLDSYPNSWVQVFTRTGQLVFESHGYYRPWDGTVKGKPLPLDTYYYIIEPNNGRDPIKGYVTIIK